MMRVCDVCDEPTSGDSVRFGWDGGFFETDLCDKHAEELGSLMERMVRTARRLGAPATSKTPTAPRTRERRPSVSTKDVRAWAAKKGIEVSERGRLPESIIEQYLAAQK